MAVELRPEETRRGLQDLVGPAELAVLPLELIRPGSLLTGQAAQLAAVDAGLADPLADGLGADAQLLGDSRDRVVALPLGGHLVDEPDGSLLIVVVQSTVLSGAMARMLAEETSPVSGSMASA